MVEQQQDSLRSFARVAHLELNPVQGNFDAAHLKEIHRKIFDGQPQHASGEYRPDAPAHIKARLKIPTIVITSIMHFVARLMLALKKFLLILVGQIACVA